MSQLQGNTPHLSRGLVQRRLAIRILQRGVRAVLQPARPVPVMSVPSTLTPAEQQLQERTAGI